MRTTANRIHHLFSSQSLGLGYRTSPFSAKRFWFPPTRSTSSVTYNRPSSRTPGTFALLTGLSLSAAVLLNYKTAHAESSSGPSSKTQPATITTPEQLKYNATIVPYARISKREGGQNLKPLDAEGLERVLCRLEGSYTVDRGRGVLRFDTTQIPSNDPMEDEHSEAVIEAPGLNGQPSSGDWVFWGVYDGHSGWATSSKLRHTLIGQVYAELKSIFSKATSTPKSEEIDDAIKTAFTRLDHEIIQTSVEKMKKSKSRMMAPLELGPALSGSCALLSFFDSETNLLRVACTGDSRAILGRKNDNGMWTTTALSVDQTGSNPDEEARIRALHPGEKDAILNGRVTGRLEPSRAFGDAVYKWSREISTSFSESSFFVRSIYDRLKTPPYVTSEPVITTTKIDPTKGDFVVMATDSLWECLTNEEVVGLVGKWIDKQATGRSVSEQSSEKSIFGRLRSAVFSQDDKTLPVELSEAITEGRNKTVFRPKQWNLTRGHERFVFKDDNAATHIARNSLGGDETDFMAGLLGTPSPHSRRFRDDLTITVIFFGNENDTASLSSVADLDTPRNRLSKL